jgi:hypothetical protein
MSLIREINVIFKHAEIIVMETDFVTMEHANVIKDFRENFAKIENAPNNAMAMGYVFRENVHATWDIKELM